MRKSSGASRQCPCGSPGAPQVRLWLTCVFDEWRNRMIPTRSFSERSLANHRLAFMETGGWRGLTGAVVLATIFATCGPVRADVILQYFESRHATMAKRLPDVFMAGYRAIWIPPTNRAEGGQSAGYDAFDRFDVSPFYGSADDLKNLIQE